MTEGIVVHRWTSEEIRFHPKFLDWVGQRCEFVESNLERLETEVMRSFWIVFMLAGSLGLASGAAADNDSDIFRRIGMLGEWAVDCGLPPGPTNQHYVFGPSESGEVIALSRNGRREFVAATFRNIRVISDTRVGWRSSGDGGSTTDVIVERNGSRFRDLQSVRIDGKILLKNGVMLEQGWGTPWLEKCAGPPTATISQQAMVDAWDDCKSVRITTDQSAAVQT